MNTTWKIIESVAAVVLVLIVCMFLTLVGKMMARKLAPVRIASVAQRVRPDFHPQPPIHEPEPADDLLTPGAFAAHVRSKATTNNAIAEEER